MEEKYLPIGTVILGENSEKPLMIIGFCVTTPDKPDVMYDYCGCLYPEGVVDTSKNLLFNHDKIKKVLFMGYKSEMEKEFKQKLDKILKDMNANAK